MSQLNHTPIRVTAGRSACRSINHVILLQQWGLQQAPEVQDLSKMLFFDRAVDSGRKLGPPTALLGQNAVREIPAEASLPRSPPQEFSDHASRFGQTSWGKIVGAANGANFPSRGSQSYMFVESSLFGNSIATKRPPPRHVRGHCARGPKARQSARSCLFSCAHLSYSTLFTIRASRMGSFMRASCLGTKAG